MKRIISISIIIFIVITLVDYMNIPSSIMGLKINNINWDLYTGTMNAIVVIVLYMITYLVLNQKEVEKENNKLEIASILLRECYEQCETYIELLTDEVVRENIVTKLDPNSSTPNPIILNLQNAPFENENIIMDLAKDGQLTKQQIESYLKVKQKFHQYVMMRIIFFDAPKYYGPLKTELLHLLQ